MVTYHELKQLGYMAFGPILAPFIMRVSQRAAETGRDQVFLSREGYFLRRITQDYYLGRYRDRVPPRFLELKVSRGLMCRLCLPRADLLPLAIKHSYTGTIGSFLKNRFNIIGDKFESVRSVMDVPITLPKDRSIVIEVITHLLDDKRLSAELNETKQVYDEYLRNLIGNDEFDCVDLGYTGSIQTVLSAIYGYNTHGLYMLLNKEAFLHASRDLPITAEGIYSESAYFGSGSVLIDASLILEGLLTAPHGPVIDVQRDTRTQLTRFVYGHETRSQESFQTLVAITDGVIEFLNDATKRGLSDKDITEMIDLEKHYELQLKFNRNKAMLHFIDIIEIEDSISVFERLSPFSFLPVLQD